MEKSKIASQDKANADLNEKISQHMQSINQLNREKVMLESLLDIKSKALKKYTKVVDAKDAAGDQHQMFGYQYASKEQYAQAVEEYKLALQTDSSQKDIYYNLGFVYAKLGKMDDAVANYLQVLKLDPNDKETCYNLSFIYKKLSDTKKSQEYYNRYLELKK